MTPREKFLAGVKRRLVKCGYAWFCRGQDMDCFSRLSRAKKADERMLAFVAREWARMEKARKQNSIGSLVSPFQEAFEKSLTEAQRKMKSKHGTPAEFLAAVYQAVPGGISMDEAAAAVREYNREWFEASRERKKARKEGQS